MHFPFFYRFFARPMGSLTYQLSRVYLPLFLRKKLLLVFARFFGICVSESEHPIEAYTSLNAFFTRGLHAQARDIKNTWLMCPVDGYLLCADTLHRRKMIQAKGIDYDISALLGSDTLSYNDGSYATIYLSPKDCHRVFAPCRGTVVTKRFIAGRLFPVREPYIGHFKGLYTHNERLVFELQTLHHGKVAVVMVGAVNVGKLDANVKEGDGVEQGDWMGTFHLGSTVIVCFEQRVSLLKTQGTVQIGQSLVCL